MHHSACLSWAWSISCVDWHTDPQWRMRDGWGIREKRSMGNMHILNTEKWSGHLPSRFKVIVGLKLGREVLKRHFMGGAGGDSWRTPTPPCAPWLQLLQFSGFGSQIKKQTHCSMHSGWLLRIHMLMQLWHSSGFIHLLLPGMKPALSLPTVIWLTVGSPSSFNYARLLFLLSCLLPAMIPRTQILKRCVSSLLYFNVVCIFTNCIGRNTKAPHFRCFCQAGKFCLKCF